MNRRTFLGQTAIAGAAFTVVPRHVLGGPGQTPPSEKITVALIGCGYQGHLELPGLLAEPQVQMAAVCDPNRESADYVDWGRDGLRRSLAAALGKPDWRAGTAGCLGGREVAREYIELYYGARRPAGSFKGVAVYTDFRELLAREKGIDAVKVMTPDHLHATVAIAALNAGKQVIMHKPLANRLAEARAVIQTARRTGLATHFLPAQGGEGVRICAEWIRQGAIGSLRQIHNWSNRPVWPQYAKVPTDTPPVPKDFDWDLWLGPSQPRAYHPHYTHAVFRGWYEFGGGPVADMGHYSLWRVFREFGLDAPVSVESTPSHVCEIVENVSRVIRNDYSFPAASTIRFKFAAKGPRPALDLFWYDGGMKPATPEEVEQDNQELAAEGMLFVGDQGKILAGFRGENPRLIPERKAAGQRPPPLPPGGNDSWVKAFKGGPATDGNFLLAGPISEAFNLGAISLRLGGRRLAWDSARQKITNLDSANRYLTRDYRKGWEIKTEA